ncbi:glycosyltransferase family 4 protein [Citricoccus sp.]|uniref:glycosyltransferase family 4 protein n=1 Tax=Citricoccus sp. TaxID=1978372 RepID=UPI0028BDE580|nr:glycosyltransferase family 4 protein [Citricoccus sp.]
MTDSAPREFALRPHMVMLVGNHMVGDSRVEKSAVSAVKAGYRVTIVGTRHRSTFHIGEYVGIPLYRIPADFARHVTSGQWKELKPRRWPEDADPLACWGRVQDAPAWSVRSTVDRVDRATHAVRTRLGKHLDHRATRVAQAVGQVRDRSLAALPRGWRRVWPHIADYEDAFLDVLRRLDPDLIHVHDRHPLPGAAAYAAWKRSLGQEVPWVYDAHEWLPGQELPGPTAARTGWLAAEAELIHHADAVLTVSDELATRMQQRHHLKERPGTVINAPALTRTPMDPAVRRPIREECGLGPETPLFVYVGKMSERRGVLTMVESLPLLPDTHIAFIGSRDVAIRQRIMERAEQLGVADRVHLKDYVPSSSVTWYIESATGGISPLLSTPAHQLAIATKISEYVQAGLPVIVSDMKAQAAFVRDHGIGTVFAAGDPADLAAATHQLLEGLEGFHRAVHQGEVRTLQTWDHAERELIRTWTRLCAPATPATEAGGPVNGALVSGASVDSTSADGAPGPALDLIGAGDQELLAHVWTRHAGSAMAHPGLEPSETAGDADLPEVLATWSDINRHADVVLYAGHVSAGGGDDGPVSSEMRSLMARGKKVGIWTGSAPLVDPRLLLRAHPDHPLAQWTTEQLTRYRRQVHRGSRPLLELQDLGVPIFTTDATAADLLTDVHWVPSPVAGPRAFADEPASPQTEDRPPQVLIIPALRSSQELASLDTLEATATAAGYRVARPRAKKFHPSDAVFSDIVVDTLTTGGYSEASAWAWSAARLVVGRAGTPIRGVELPENPLVAADPSTVVETVMALAHPHSSDQRGEAGTAGRAFAESVHDGRLTVRRILTVLDGQR